jgi:hypothetical protein
LMHLGENRRNEYFVGYCIFFSARLHTGLQLVSKTKTEDAASGCLYSTSCSTGHPLVLLCKARNKFSHDSMPGAADRDAVTKLVWTMRQREE